MVGKVRARKIEECSKSRRFTERTLTFMVTHHMNYVTKQQRITW